MRNHPWQRRRPSTNAARTAAPWLGLWACLLLPSVPLQAQTPRDAGVASDEIPTGNVYARPTTRVYKYTDAQGVRSFSDRAPRGTRFEVLYYNCFACDPESKVDWHNTPLFLRPFAAAIDSIARQHGVDPALVRAVIHAESAFRPDALSRRGAQGLMQLMPGTAQELGVQDAFLPEQNIDGGVRYLANLLNRHQGDIRLATAAYNAGPGAVRRHQGVPPFAETRAYVERVGILHQRYRAALAAAGTP